MRTSSLSGRHLEVFYQRVQPFATAFMALFGKEYSVLNHPLVQARLHLPPDQVQQRPESQIARSLFDCPQIPLGPEGVSCRVVVATHPAEQNSKKKQTVGITREGVVYELFCPAGHSLHPHERRREADGSLRVVYGASIRSCLPARCASSANGRGAKRASPAR